MAHIVGKAGYTAVKRMFAKVTKLGKCLTKCPCGLGLLISTFLPYVDYVVEMVSLPLAVLVYVITFLKCCTRWRFWCVTRYIRLPTPVMHTALAVDTYTKKCEKVGTCTVRGKALHKQVLTEEYIYDPSAIMKLKVCMTVVQSSLCEMLKVLLVQPIACTFDTFMIQRGEHTDVKIDLIFPMSSCCGSFMAQKSCREYGHKVLYDLLLIETKAKRGERFGELCQQMTQEDKAELDEFAKGSSLMSLAKGTALKILKDAADASGIPASVRENAIVPAAKAKAAAEEGAAQAQAAAEEGAAQAQAAAEEGAAQVKAVAGTLFGKAGLPFGIGADAKV
jgi:hypothetical protein